MNGRRAGKRNYGILLALSAGAILILGLVFKPHEQLRPATSEERVEAVRADLNSLRELAQRNSLRNTSARFSAMAASDAAFLMRTDEGDPATLWPAGGVLVAGIPAPPAALALDTNDRQPAASLAAWGAGIPFTRYSARSQASVANTVKVEDLQPGTWMLVDALGKDGPEFLPGMFGGIARTTCEGVDYTKIVFSAPFDPRFLGAAMFDVDGNLAALLAQCDAEIAAIPVDEIDAHLAYVSQAAQLPFAHLGLIAKRIAAPLDTLLPTSAGLVVTDIWTDWPAGIAGILAGDVILTVNNLPATSAEQLSAALGTLPTKLRIERAPNTLIDLTLTPSGGTPAVAFETQSRAVTLLSVADPRAVRAGLRAGDRILTVAGHPATEKSVAQSLSPAYRAPVLLAIERGDRQLLVLVNQ